MGAAGRRTSPLPIFLLTEDSRQTPPDDPERRMGKGLTKAEGNSGSLAEKRKGIRWRGRDPKGFPRAGTLVRFHSRSSATGRFFSFRRHLAPFPLSLSIHSSSAHPPSLFNFIPHHPPFLPPLSLLSVLLTTSSCTLHYLSSYRTHRLTISQVFRYIRRGQRVHLDLRHRPRLQRRRLWYRDWYFHPRPSVLSRNLPTSHLCAPQEVSSVVFFRSFCEHQVWRRTLPNRTRSYP